MVVCYVCLGDLVAADYGYCREHGRDVDAKCLGEMMGMLSMAAMDRDLLYGAVFACQGRMAYGD